MMMMFAMHCFKECTSVYHVWQQAQLSLSILVALHGFRCLSHYSSAAYIASLIASESNPNILYTLVQHYNSLVPFAERFNGSSFAVTGHQKVLTSRFENHQYRLPFQSLLCLTKHKFCLPHLPHAVSWLQVVPAPGLYLHLDLSELYADMLQQAF